MPQKSRTMYGPIVASALGDNTLAASADADQIRVLSAILVASGGANTIRFESGPGGTALTGLIDLPADGQLIIPLNGFGWFETDVGDVLNLELSAATLVAGCLVYEEIDP